jgi:hypothetical protein
LVRIKKEGREMIIEFQITADAFAQIIRNRIRATPLCFPQETAGLFVEHLEYPSDTTLLSAPDSSTIVFNPAGHANPIAGTRLRVVQPVRLCIASRQAVIDGSGGAPTAFALEPIVTISLDIRAEVGTNPFIATDPFAPITTVDVTASFGGIDWGDIGQQLSPQDKAKVEGSLQSFTESTSIDLSNLSSLLGGSTTVINAGLALDDSHTRVALRIEVIATESDTVASWQQFYNGLFPDRVGDGSFFAFFLDGDLLAQATESLVRSQLDAGIASPDPNVKKYVIDNEPTGFWSPAGSLADLITGGTPEVTVNFDITMVDACGPKDIGVHPVTMVFVFSVVDDPNGGKALQSAVTITWDLVDSDVAVCALEVGALGALAGALVGSIFGPIGAVVGAIAGIVAGVVVVIAKAGAASPGNAFDNAQCQTISSPDDDHVTMICTSGLPQIDSSLFGHLEPEEAVGFIAGMVLRGGIEISNMASDLVYTVTEPSFSSHVNCNTKRLDVTFEAWADFHDNVYVFGCQWSKFGDDPQNAFSCGWVNIENGARLVLNFNPDDPTAYFANPYSAHILAKTSSGARAITFAPVPLPPVQPDPITWPLEVTNICDLAYDKFWKGRYNPKWSVDPGPEERAIHDWTVAAVGLVPGDRVTLIGAAGTLVARTADASGAVLLRAVVTPDTDRDGVIVERRTESNREPVRLNALDRTHRLAVWQQLLIDRGAAPVGGTPMSLVTVGARPGLLVAVADRGIRVYSVDGAFTPRLTQQFAGDFRGATSMGSRILVYGGGRPSIAHISRRRQTTSGKAG